MWRKNSSKFTWLIKMLYIHKFQPIFSSSRPKIRLLVFFSPYTLKCTIEVNCAHQMCIVHHHREFRASSQAFTMNWTWTYTNGKNVHKFNEQCNGSEQEYDSIRFVLFCGWLYIEGEEHERKIENQRKRNVAERREYAHKWTPTSINISMHSTIQDSIYNQTHTCTPMFSHILAYWFDMFFARMANISLSLPCENSLQSLSVYVQYAMCNVMCKAHFNIISKNWLNGEEKRARAVAMHSVNVR